MRKEIKDLTKNGNTTSSPRVDPETKAPHKPKEIHISPTPLFFPAEKWWESEPRPQYQMNFWYFKLKIYL